MIVAEMSANHNGKKETAIETVRAAKRAGADAVKLQTYRADTITLRCDKPDFIINEGSIWDGQYFYDLYEQAYTCLLYTSPSPRDKRKSRMPSSA